MTFPTAFNAMLQAIGALLLFVAGYLALILFTIICLVVAELISERAGPVRAYGVRTDSLDGGSSKVQGNTCAPTGLHRTYQTEAAIHGFAWYGDFHPHVSGFPDRRHIRSKVN